MSCSLRVKESEREVGPERFQLGQHADVAGGEDRHLVAHVGDVHVQQVVRAKLAVVLHHAHDLLVRDCLRYERERLHVVSRRQVPARSAASEL